MTFAITPVFSVILSFRNHIMCWFAAQEIFIIIKVLKMFAA